MMTDNNDNPITAITALADRARPRVIAFEHNGVKVPMYLDSDDLAHVAKEVDGYVEERQPSRRSGRWGAHTIDSLAKWINRWGIPGQSTVYASLPNCTIEAVADDHPCDSAGGPPSRRAMRCVFTWRTHQRLTLWQSIAGKDLDVDAFVDFIEANHDDLCDLSLVTMVRNLEISDSKKWKREVDGNGKLRLRSEEERGSSTPVPSHASMFVPFIDGRSTLYIVNMRISMKMANGSPKFRVDLLDVLDQQRKALADMVDELTVGVSASLGCQVFYGVTT